MNYYYQVFKNLLVLFATMEWCYHLQNCKVVTLLKRLLWNILNNIGANIDTNCNKVKKRTNSIVNIYILISVF